MKVTSGFAGGIHIDYPACARPTIDKVRQAIFSALYSRIDFEGARVLDMFAGSGALGIESLSRGAEYAVFLEKNKKACEVIRQNIQNCKFREISEILQIDFEKYQSQEKFDIIFLDPPYHTNLLQKALKKSIDFAHNETLIVCESDKEITYSSGFEIVFKKKYGTIYISILRLKEK